MESKLNTIRKGLTVEHDHTLDVCGLCCAQPIIHLTRELKGIESGKVLLVMSDKSSSLLDIPAYCKQTGNTLLHKDEFHRLYRFWIRKKQ